MTEVDTSWRNRWWPRNSYLNWVYQDTRNEPAELRYWSIDDGGRVLMDMILDNFPGMVVTEFQDFMQTLIENMIRIGSHKRRAFDGVAYTWTAFVQWYGYTQFTDAHWRTAGPSC